MLILWVCSLVWLLDLLSRLLANTCPASVRSYVECARTRSRSPTLYALLWGCWGRRLQASSLWSRAPALLLAGSSADMIGPVLCLSRGAHAAGSWNNQSLT